MADNQQNKTNQSSGAQTEPKPGSVTAPSASNSSSVPTSPGGNSKVPNVSDLPGMGLLKSPIAWVAVIVLVLLVAFSTFFVKKLNAPSNPVATPLAVSSPIPGASPIALPAVREQTDIDLLSTYFANTSASFKSEFMAKTPQKAVEAYKQYTTAASDDAKLQAARNFYIYLNNPAAPQDAEYREFLEDIKADLEKGLGKNLF